jgi:hypothetical protein
MDGFPGFVTTVSHVKRRGPTFEKIILSLCSVVFLNRRFAHVEEDEEEKKQWNFYHFFISPR